MPKFSSWSVPNPFKKRAVGDCVGDWVDVEDEEKKCDNCKPTGKQVYKIESKGADTGAPCEAVDGQIRDTKCICKKDCEGIWEVKQKCGVNGATMQTERFRVRKVANEQGEPCEAKHGETKQTPCGGLTPSGGRGMTFNSAPGAGIHGSAYSAFSVTGTVAALGLVSMF